MASVNESTIIETQIKTPLKTASGDSLGGEIDDDEEGIVNAVAPGPQSYQIRPALSEIFKASKVKQVVQGILQDKLQGKTYNSADAKIWTKEISNDVNIAVHELCMKRYRHVVQVTLGQQLGSGCRYIARCRWDAECDGYTSEVFTNATLFCICTVFGIYLY